ncbi:MAG: flagellar assembly protein FliW [Clostridiaceae bacterium]|jgi:flagellar assembly factor FliW|nr:flagellar assembly protein FliW [Clostridiaceae bacterium]
MHIQTTVFGELEINEDKIITFPEGIPGFENLTRFVMIILDQTKPFLWLQSVDEDVSIPVISPFEFDADYAPSIDDGQFAHLELEKEEDLLVLVVAVIPPVVTHMTANLAAPILINTAANIGIQALVENGEFPVRFPIFEAISRQMRKEALHAGTDTADS